LGVVADLTVSGAQSWRCPIKEPDKRSILGAIADIPGFATSATLKAKYKRIS
jgi:hypothetical protein